eukprot:750499-Hanusia_phi.AAC.2
MSTRQTGEYQDRTCEEKAVLPTVQEDEQEQEGRKGGKAGEERRGVERSKLSERTEGAVDFEQRGRGQAVGIVITGSHFTKRRLIKD